MTPPILLLLGSSVLGIVAVLVATGVIDLTASDRRSATPSDPSGDVGWRAAAAVGVTAIAVSTTGWLLPSAIAGMGAWRYVRHAQRKRRQPASGVEMTEALASWIESLRDVLIAGDQPIGAIAATTTRCPQVLRPHVRRLSARLNHIEPAIAFRRFADDVNDPLGDLVAAGLLIAVDRGARTVGVLTSLAEQARHQADRRRIVEAERAPVRREVGVLTVIMGSLIGALFFFGRSSYLDAYDTAAGQLFLAVCLVAYGGLLMRVQQLANERPPARFISMQHRQQQRVPASARSVPVGARS